MAGYKIFLKASAAREIDAVDSKVDRRRIVARIAALAENPRSPQTEKLAGYDDRYRIRSGQYRIVYFIDDAQGQVTIFKVGHRRDIYR